MSKIEIVKAIKEMKNQLAYSKNMSFFFGAGSSCALGIPNIEQLTLQIEEELKDDENNKIKSNFLVIKDDIKKTHRKEKVNIEDILNQARLIAEITHESDINDYISITGYQAKLLDKSICNLIYNIISEKEKESDLTIPTKFFSWLDLLNREYVKEVFTTNYDLIFEKALENRRIPYFDGFIGSYEPFFFQESIESQTIQDLPPNSWIRLWKIHGSLSWFWKKDLESRKIIRIGKINNLDEENRELVIYPSKEKYDTSRKQPFIAYFDRLKNCLLSGELLFIISGYSFGDQHINDIIFNCLRQNNRLFCLVFFYKDEEVECLSKEASTYLNLNVFGPTKALINGILGEYVFVDDEKEKTEFYWDKENSKIFLGDFRKLVDFLIQNSGKTELFKFEKQNNVN